MTPTLTTTIAAVAVIILAACGLAWAIEKAERRARLERARRRVRRRSQ